MTVAPAVFVTILVALLPPCVAVDSVRPWPLDDFYQGIGGGDASCNLADGDSGDESGEGGCLLHRPRLVIHPVARVDAANLTADDFKVKYSPPDRAVPLLITGLGARTGEAIDPSQWTRSALRELCGDVPLMHTMADGTREEECGEDTLFPERNDDCHDVRGVRPELVGKEWAGLATADLKKWRIDTMADLIDRQDEDEGGRGLYLHDAKLVHYCPPALDLLPGVPKYFRRDYEHVNDDWVFAGIAPEGDDFWTEYKDDIHFPSIFVGKGGGTGSPLHTDVKLTRFWKLQLSGRKQWRVVSPADNHRVYPTDPSAHWGSEASSVYGANLFSPDFDAHPLMDGLVVYETIAEPGDVLFLPEGWPHQVRNLDDSISVSYNFVDNDNLGVAREYKQWELNMEGEEEWKDDVNGMWESFFLPLDDPPPRLVPLTDGSGEVVEADFVPFRQFFFDQNLRVMTEVPFSVLRFVEDRRRAASRSMGEEVDSAHLAAAVGAHWDRYGRPPLHVAVAYHHLPVLKYLLDEVGVDPLLQDGHGWTAFLVLEALEYTENGAVFETLEERMKVVREKEGKNGREEMCPLEEFEEKMEEMAENITCP